MPDEPIRPACDEASCLRKDSEAPSKCQHGSEEPDVASKRDEIAGENDGHAAAGGLAQDDQKGERGRARDERDRISRWTARLRTNGDEERERGNHGCLERPVAGEGPGTCCAHFERRLYALEGGHRGRRRG